ncbi:hypothetical protein ETU10_04210 [Apibacter muscae]|uniref:aminotransferase class IV n=1 Tax=Apibacter muscae TaxID=2509004 RepID=UPI0011AD5FAF|nr:aminotransferase class IV [Apibacter muscae]TWP24453.1 hypothetical protein ETU10_04210 [Apibacter muscae]
MAIIFNQEYLEEGSVFFNNTKKSIFSGYYVNSFCWLFQGDLIFWEDTYFQLMASLRKMRMEIPISFTPEMFKSQILLLSEKLSLSNGLAKISAFRDDSRQEKISFIIELIDEKFLSISKSSEIDFFKEILIYPNLLSAIEIFHPINEVASQYAKENEMVDVILLNNEKRIARSMKGNVFLIRENIIYSPPISEGAMISSIRKNFIQFLREKTSFIYKEEPMSPFSVQSSAEVFILGDKTGAISILKSRKNSFSTHQTELLMKKFIGYAISTNKDE